MTEWTTQPERPRPATGPAGAESPRAQPAGSESLQEQPAPRRVLYRCRTPTNVLCPCGAVARRLKKHGLEYRTERLSYRRADRAEIVELTKQKYLPVLVDGDEVINDSRRILQYLDWAYGAERRARETGETGEGETAAERPAGED